MRSVLLRTLGIFVLAVILNALFGDQEWWGKYTPQWFHDSYCEPNSSCRNLFRVLGFLLGGFLFTLMSLDAKRRATRVADACIAILLVTVAIGVAINGILG